MGADFNRDMDNPVNSLNHEQIDRDGDVHRGLVYGDDYDNEHHDGLLDRLWLIP